MILFSCESTPNEVVLTRPVNEIALDTIKVDSIHTQNSTITIGGTDILITPGGAQYLELNLDTAGQIQTLKYKRYDKANTNPNQLQLNPSHENEGKKDCPKLPKASSNPK